MGENNVGVAFTKIKPQIDREGKITYMLNATKDELKAAPAFEWIKKPTLANQNTTSEKQEA